MLKKFSLLLILILGASVAFGQQLNVELQGKWAEGRCEAIYRRSHFAFVGNGAYLQVYLDKHDGNFEWLTEELLPGVVHDIWVSSDLQAVYVAAGSAGLQILQLDTLNRTVTRIREIGTTGFASGVGHYFRHVYVAAGEQGLLIVNVNNIFNPYIEGRFKTSRPARDVWVVNDSLSLVAAGETGLYTVSTRVKDNPTALDSVQFNALFGGFNLPDPQAQSVFAIGQIAYVATGYGGLRLVDIQNTSAISQISSWIYTVPRDIKDMQIRGSEIYLVSGEDGLFGPIDISDPENPGTLVFPPMDTDGYANNIWITGDTAYVCDRTALLLVDIESGVQPQIERSIPTADVAYDVETDGGNAFLASGYAGLKIFNLTFNENTSDHLDLLSTFDTPGEVRGLEIRDGFAFMADGSSGLQIADVFTPGSPQFYGQYSNVGDTCYDVSIYDEGGGNYALLAAGKKGLVIIDYSGIELYKVHEINTPGSARKIRVSDNRAFLADSSGVYVYNIIDLPDLPVQINALTTNMDAYSLEINGDTLFVANGQYGLLVWNLQTDEVTRVSTGGFITDLFIRDKTIYLTDAEYGLRIFDFSSPGLFTETGYYQTRERPSGVTLSSNGTQILMADGPDGLFVFASSIQPDIVLSPASPLEFGPVPPGESRKRFLRFINTGTTLLRIENIQWLNSMYSFSNRSLSVAPGDTQVIEVRFTPVIGGNVNQIDQAVIYTNDPDEPTVELTLQGRIVMAENEGPYSRDEFTIGLYHMDDAVISSTVQDASVYVQNATVHGFPVQVDAQSSAFGKALNFDGEEDYLTIPYHTPFNFADSPFSVELWFSIAELPDTYAILIRRGDAATRQIELALDNTNSGLIASVWDAAGNQHMISSGSIEVFQINQWYHAAFTWDTDSTRLYLNGDQVAGERMNLLLRSQTSEPMAIGATSTGYIPFKGRIDEVHISGIARQPWEFHVNRARISVRPSTIEFGKVLFGQSRRVPVTIVNQGSQLLLIQNIYTLYGSVSVEASTPISLPAGSSSIFWVTYRPQQDTDHADSKTLTITSSDPTYPNYVVPMSGKAVSSFRAGAYLTDPFTLGLYHFDDNHTGVASDSSGQEMNGVFVGNVMYDSEQRKFGEGFSVAFTRNDSRIRIRPESDDILTNKWGGFTVETWFMMEVFPVTQSVLIRRGSVSANQFDLFVDNGGRVIGRLYNNLLDFYEVNSADIGVVQLNQWYHAAMVQRNDSLYLYINGNEIDKTGFVGPMASESSHPTLDTLSVLVGGGWGSVNAFAGHMDEIRFSGVGRLPWEFNVNMARISISPSVLNFGDVYLGSTRTLDLNVNNTLGLDTLIVDTVTIDLNTYFSADLSGFKLAPGANRRIRVTYDASTLGQYEGKMVFHTNDPFYPERQVDLKGKTSPIITQAAYLPDAFTLSLFHLDEIAEDGVTLGDSSGTGLTGTITENVALSDTGRFGKSLKFSGGAFQIPSDAVADKVYGYFTIETWIQLTEKNVDGSMIAESRNGSKQFEIAFTPGQNGILSARLWNQQGLSFILNGPAIQSININQWYHIAMSIDGYWARFIFNGVVVDSTAFIGDIMNLEDGTIWFGHDSEGQRSFKGFMDEIRISNIDRKSWDLNIIQPQILVSDYQIAFEEVKLGYTRTLELLIKNLGDQTLRVTSVQGIDTVFSIPEIYNNFEIQRLDSLFLPISFRPADVDDYQKTITLVSNAQNSPNVAIRLTGTGYANPGAVEYVADGYTLVLYHFDESRGDTIYDASGNSYSGFLWNGARIAAQQGYFGSGIRFDGFNDRVEIPAKDAFQNDLRFQSLTLECYFRTDTVSQVIVGKGFQDSLLQGDLVISINSIGRLAVNGLGGTGPRINDNAWHHLGFVYDHRIHKAMMYLDFVMIWSLDWDIDSPRADLIRPLLLGAAERKTGGYTGYFQGYIDEFRFSNINREVWNFNAPEDAGIRIATPFPAAPKASEPVTINVEIPFQINPSSVSVYYREAGLNEFMLANAVPESDTRFSANIPASAVTLRGLEYYIYVVSQTQKVFTHPIIDPVHRPLSLPIRFESMATNFEFSAQPLEDGKFQLAVLFSIPFMLDPVGPDTVLNTFIGDYDPFQWRLFWWDPLRSTTWYKFGQEGQIYIEYSEGDKYYFSLPPGRAYWLVSNVERQFTLQAGRTVTTDSTFQKRLFPGWNLIGNPFNFNVKWSDCSVSSNLVTPPYAYLGLDGYQPDISVLEPWNGYWIYHGGIDTVFLYIQSIDAGLSKSTPEPHGLLSDLSDSDWLLKLSATDGKSRDQYNYVGVRENGLPLFDLYDRPEPPPAFGHSICLFIDHSDWKKQKGMYAADIREPGSEGQVWNIDVQCLPHKDVRLSWEMTQDLPEDWNIYLIDHDQEIAVDISKVSLYQFDVPQTGQHPFKIIAGTENFLQQRTEGVSLEPVEFKLYPSMPNPFNPVTTIRFSIPKKSDVEFYIYNAVGQRVRVIRRENCRSGHHTIEWNGTDDQGMKLASGVYIYQLRAAGKTETRKMILLK
jgi:hypothetical protein